ncbi:MAG: DUF6273 domain-containing protein [Oscillospiraceae bacterium]|jgi:hypothetical protein|nr:DUF6273 domain-containing protein [Oscillospiraceae bacterium]
MPRKRARNRACPALLLAALWLPCCAPSERPSLPPPARGAENIFFGGYEWRVLAAQDGKALLLAEEIIAFNIYDVRVLPGIGVPVTWESSALREYLNGEFYGSFSEEDRARIIETVNKNGDNPWYGKAYTSKGGGDTSDKIFLLSIEEVLHYFGGGALPGEPAKDTWVNDQYNASRIALTALPHPHRPEDFPAGTAWLWWLRSPGAPAGFYGGAFHESGISRAAFVSAAGYVSVYGFPVDEAEGVRPALWLEL